MKRTHSESIWEPPNKRLRTGSESAHVDATPRDLDLPFSFNNLSDELYIHIFALLSWKDLCALSTTSKQWSRLASDNQLWRALYLKEYGRPRLRGSQGSFGRDKADRVVKPLPSRSNPEHLVDWKWMFRISLNWRMGRCVVEQIPISSVPSSAYARTHIMLAGPLTITAPSSRGVPPFITVRNGISNAEQIFRCPDRSDSTRITCLSLDQLPSIGGQLVRFAAFFSDGRYDIYSINSSPETMKNSFSKVATYTPVTKSARCTPIISAVYHHPLLISLSASFQLSLYDLSSLSNRIQHTQTLSSFTSFPPTCLVLSTPSLESYKLVLAYTVPIYPAHWGVAATELIIARSSPHSSVLVLPTVQSSRTVRAFDVPPGWVDEAKMKAVRAQWHRRVAGIADTQTDGKWVVLAPSAAATPSRSTPLPLQLYRLSLSPPRPTLPSGNATTSSPPSSYPSSTSSSLSLAGNGGAKLTFVRDLAGQTAPVSAMSVADGRCVCLGLDGSLWVWDLENGLDGVEVEGPRSSFAPSEPHYARPGPSLSAAVMQRSWDDIPADEDSSDVAGIDDIDFDELHLSSSKAGTVVFDERRVLCAGSGASGRSRIDIFRFDI